MLIAGLILLFLGLSAGSVAAVSTPPRKAMRGGADVPSLDRNMYGAASVMLMMGALLILLPAASSILTDFI